MTSEPLPISPASSVVSELRIFISSTFRDLQQEREHLVKKVFPEIRDLCRLRGVELTEVDLRWGIAEDESRPGRIIRTCLEEIDRCRPYFIGIIGDRYGWVPSPDLLHDDPDLRESYPWLERALREGRSITEIEFLYGALSAERSGSCALFFRRQIDRNGSADDSGERSRLDRLMEATERTGYNVTGYLDPEALGDAIRREMLALVERRWPIDRLPGPLEIERHKHEAFASTRRRAYIPNPRYLERFAAFLGRESAENVAALVIQAGSGSGKSSLISYLAAHLAGVEPDTFAITHFIGAGSSDGDRNEVIRRIMTEIRDRFELDYHLLRRQGRLDFFLAWLRRAVESRYLPDGRIEPEQHARLAEYFRRGPYSLRLAEELPWQLQKAGDIARLCDAVADVQLFGFLATEEIYRGSIERYAVREPDELKVAEAIDGMWEMLELARYLDGVVLLTVWLWYRISPHRGCRVV